MRTHNITSFYRKSKRYLYYASRPGELELLLSRTSFHSPKGFRAIGVGCLYNGRNKVIQLTQVSSAALDPIIFRMLIQNYSQKFVNAFC